MNIFTRRATFIPGGTSIPDSRVGTICLKLAFTSRIERNPWHRQMFDCHHLFGTFIASHKVRWEKWIAKREEKYRQFNAANYCIAYYIVWSPYQRV